MAIAFDILNTAPGLVNWDRTRVWCLIERTLGIKRPTRGKGMNAQSKWLVALVILSGATHGQVSSDMSGQAQAMVVGMRRHEQG
jgi:hypothetical protein